MTTDHTSPIGDRPMTIEESNIALAKVNEYIDEVQPEFISNDYYHANGKKLNQVSQKSIFSDHVFTANADRLMFNFKHFGNPIGDIDEYANFMDQDLAYNITKFEPSVGQFILLGISSISPLVLSGVSKVDGPDIDKYTTPFQYYVVGVYNKELNHRFGMKALFTLKLNPQSRQPNGFPIGADEDPLSTRNLRAMFMETKAKKEVLANKDLAANNKVVTRMLLIVDEMEINGYTY